MKAKLKESMGRAQGRLIHKASKMLDAKAYKFHAFGLLAEVNAHDVVESGAEQRFFVLAVPPMRAAEDMYSAPAPQPPARLFLQAMTSSLSTALTQPGALGGREARDPCRHSTAGAGGRPAPHAGAHSTQLMM